jgi:hypothetical protein
MSENRLGDLLIHNKLISRKQFDQALEMQQINPGQPIGQILCQLGLLKCVPEADGCNKHE